MRTPDTKTQDSCVPTMSDLEDVIIELRATADIVLKLDANDKGFHWAAIQLANFAERTGKHYYAIRHREPLEGGAE